MATTRPYRDVKSTFLGFGLLAPFRRDKKKDFAADGGVRLIKSCIAQILGTIGTTERFVGELPWRPEFGSSLYLLLHRNNDEVTQELAKVYVISAIERWEPRVVIRDVLIERRKSNATNSGGPNILAIGLLYDVISANSSSNRVAIAGVTQEVELLLAA